MYCACPFQGIFISRVSEEGPAARAGVKVGDKLLEVNIVIIFNFELPHTDPVIHAALSPPSLYSSGLR